MVLKHWRLRFSRWSRLSWLVKQVVFLSHLLPTSFELIWIRRVWAILAPKRFANDCRYHDSAPILDLYLEAQQYYKQHAIPTKVKSCAFMTTDEVISMAGVDAMTLPAEMLEELSSMTDSQESLEARSVYHQAGQTLPAESTRLSYINDRTKFDRAFTTNGRGKAKTEDVSETFEYVLPLANNTSPVYRSLLRVPNSGRGIGDNSRKLRPKHRERVTAYCCQWLSLPLRQIWQFLEIIRVFTLDFLQWNLQFMDLLWAYSCLRTEI